MANEVYDSKDCCCHHQANSSWLETVLIDPAYRHMFTATLLGLVMAVFLLIRHP